MFAKMKHCLLGCSKLKTALILMLLCAIFGFFKFFFHTKATNSATTEPKLVEVVPARLQKLNQYVELMGVIHARHATLLTASGSGMLDVLIPSGEAVKKGDLLAKIINPDIEKKMNLSLSTVALSKKQLLPLIPLVKKGYVSALELNTKKQVVIDAKKDLSNARMELDNLRFYAPFDGIIGVYKKREGTQIANGEGVVSLYDPSTLLVDFDVPCHQYAHVHAGQSVRVLGHSYKLTHIQKMIDVDSAMCPADVDIRCDNCLVGSVVEVKLATQERANAIVIPFKALFLKESKPAVYVVESDKVVLRRVETGLRSKDFVEVKSGLKAGEQVIAKGQDRLYPGVSVRIVK